MADSPIDQQWDAICKRVTEAVTNNFPMEGKKNKLVLNSPLIIDDKVVEHSDLKSQENAKLNGRTWGAPVYADVSLVDKETGEQLDRSKIKLMTLPKPTQRYSYIVEGNEWQIDNLWKLRSGVYAHIKQNGELQAEFNLKTPFARSPRLYIPFSPEKRQFKLKYETSNFPLYSILKTLGVSDEEMKKEWGDSIFKANLVSGAKVDKDINTLYDKLSTKGVKASGDTAKQKVQAILETFHKSELIPETTKATLGKPLDHVNGEALLLASKRILEVARGDIPPDDRDSLIFKELHTVEDFLHDTLSNYKTQRVMHQKIGNNIDRQTKVRDVISGDLFTRPVVDFFSKDTLSRNPEQVNPLEMMSNHRATTIIAPEMGGIKNERSVTEDMTLINPSHLGFLDPIFTPECYSEDTEVFTSKGWKKWSAITYMDFLACRIEGRLEFHHPDKLHSSQYEGKMYGAKNGKIDYLVTPDHRMYVRPFYSEHSTFSIRTAAEIHGKPRTFAAGHRPYEGVPKATAKEMSLWHCTIPQHSLRDEVKETCEFFELPIVLGNNSSKNIERIPMTDWAEFMGWFLSEGCVTYKEETSSYLVRIAQTQTVNPEECEKIEALLNRLPWKWCQDSPKTSYAIGVKQLAHYLKDFGHAQDKYIPEYLFWTSVEARENLLECLLLGDGRINSKRATGKSYKQKVYCTTSPRLAADVERLAISLGHSVRIKRYTDDREERYLDIFEVRLLRHTERHALPKKGHYYIKQYSGMVYCATVQGGLLLVRRNGSVPIWLGNSEKTGITLHLPLGVKKEGNEVKTMVYDLKEHKIKYVSPAELHSEHIVLPDQVKWKNQKPVPIHSTVKMKDSRSNEIISKPFSDGRYLLITAHQLFAEATNLIPFLQNNQGNRTMTAARQATQAVGLYNREAPLVQVRAGSGNSWEKVIGSAWTNKANVNGKVVEIQKNPQNGYPDAVIVQDSSGEKHVHQMYNHFPLNDAKSFMHSTPNVKVGDKVTKGQIIADSNYTKDGVLALGTNLRVTYLPYKGYNFEDGIVISESAAQKLTSEHVHRKSIEIDPDKDFVDKKKFLAYASTASKKLNQDQLSKLGDDGIIHIGAKVAPGDILVAAVGKRDLVGEAARAVGRLDKKMFSFKDKSVVWDSQHEGEVVKVVKSPNGKGTTVFVKTLEPAEIGDKMVGRHGNKGIITRILPNGEMPRIGGPDGEHTEVLMNPSGVPTRLNLGQMLETASSKIAIKTGKPFMVQNFGGADEDYSEIIKNELKKNNLHDEDDMYDAPSGKKLGSALNGSQYILKLKHQVEKKLAVRGGGNDRYEYSLDRSPKGTGANWPGQAIGQLEFYALLAHGARHNLREMATYKSEKHLGTYNDENEHIDFWHRVQTGQPLPPPRASFAYKKFEAMLTGLGINLKKEGHQLVLQPLTDKGILAMSAGEILDPGRVLRGKDAKELEKGLFDMKVTGGLPNDIGKGLKWSHITLPEPIVNPIFVGNKQHPGPAVAFSGLKFKEFENVARGRKSIKVPSGDTKTGGQAISEILAAIQVKPEIKKLREELQARTPKGGLKLRGSDLDKKNRKLKYLMALDHLGLKANEAYTLKHIPVLPPIFRPIITMDDGAFRFDDINHYYKALGHIIKQYKEAPKELGEEGVRELRDELYDVTRSLAGLSGGTPVYDSNRKMKGLLDTISGAQPKEGYFQKRLMKRRQDLSLRSTIIPEPAMHLDHVGLPKDAAMELYKPFVVREMQSLGYSPIEALREIKAGSNLAWRSLQGAMDKRPAWLKRDPALHKASIMAFKPIAMEGKAIKIHPLVTAGFNADFDGDTMSVFVPLTDDAVRETFKMFPSNNLFSSTTGGIMYAPEQEAFLGLHLLSRWGKESGKTFSSFQEALKAKDRSQIHVTDAITINGHKTTLGRALIAQHLPDTLKADESLNKQFEDPKFELHKKDVHDLLKNIAKNDPKSFAFTVDNLKDLGNKYSYELGFSFGLKDIGAHKEIRDPIIKKSDQEADKVTADNKLTPAQKHEKLEAIYTKATKDLVDAHRPIFQKEDNNMYRMVSSGARGKMEQFRQMTIAPMLMKDGAGNTLVTPVRKSYSEGLDVGDYWTSLHGARMGTLQRVEGTSEPGRLTKEIVNVVIPNMIISKDCGTTHGIHMDINEPDIHDRFLAAPVKIAGDQVIKEGTLIDGHVTSVLKKNKIKQVVVRSPLKCNHGHGLCAKCFGLNENGDLHEIGTNIGVLAGHALGEPATQLAMDSFHTGGVAASRGGASVDKFTRLNQLLELPKVLPNAAVLAKTTGKVTKLERDLSTNGWNVHIGKEAHYIPAQRTPTHITDDGSVPLFIGAEVKKGEPISDGHINPRDYLKHTDIHTVQNYLTNELYNGIYKDERVRRRNIETVVRALTNYTQIKDPGDSHYTHGDHALRTVIEEHNRNLAPGERPIEHQPILKGAQQMALGAHEDWMARLNFQQLRNTILEGTAKGWKTDLHGTNPIPAYAFGATFGLGTKEHPEHY